MMANRLIFVSPVTRIIQQKKIIGEGGIARYNAWDKKIRSFQEKHNIEIIELVGSKRFVKLFKLLILTKEQKIFLMYPFSGIRLDRKGLIHEIIGLIYVSLMRFCARRNRVIVDISDLKYEQTIDLELTSLNSKEMKRIENHLFSCHRFWFVFAAENMRDYAVKKYCIPKERTMACRNGGDKVINKDSIQNENRTEKNYRIRYVYSGTLNKGRSIETMLAQFPDDDRYELILMGTEGEWITESRIIIERKYSRNIKVLGIVPEEEAHKIVSTCDVGLIPYDDSRPYYNLAFPTKLSFYITAGITYLTTPTQEVLRIGDELGFCAKMDDWCAFFSRIDMEAINIKKDIIKARQEEFTWEHTLKCPWIDPL